MVAQNDIYCVSLLVQDRTMDRVTDFAALIATLSAFVAIGINQIAGSQFNRQVLRKMRVDRDDVKTFWRLGRWSCLFAALAFAAVAPILFDADGIEFSFRSQIDGTLLLAASGAAILLLGNAVYIFNTKNSLKWRAGFLDWEDRQDCVE